MRIFRIEDANHGGPYNGAGSVGSDNFRNYAQLIENDRYASPPRNWIAPWEDIPGWPRPDPLAAMLGYSLINERVADYVFGFANVAQANNWFGRFAPLLIERGFMVGEYDVADHDVMMGEHQVAFRKAPAKFIRHINLEDFLSTSVDETIAA